MFCVCSCKEQEKTSEWRQEGAAKDVTSKFYKFYKFYNDGEPDDS